MNIEDVNRHNAEMLKKYGWYAHYVPSGDKTPTGANYHTHGMEKSYGHKNIQMVLPIDPTVAHGIISAIIDEVKNGKTFVAGVDYEDIMANGFKVRFIDAKECGREVLRLLIPDKNHKFEGAFAKQLQGLDNQEGIDEEDRVTQVD